MADGLRFTPVLRLVFGIQLTSAELTVIAAALRATTSRRLLVFGLGNDSQLWSHLNEGGRTVFIEDDPQWSSIVRRRAPWLDVVEVRYTTVRDNWRRDLEQIHDLALDLPDQIKLRSWDVVVVDAPKGHRAGHPGRVQSLATAARLVAPHGWIFVHDLHRELENETAARLFGEPQLRVGLLGGFRPDPVVP